MSAGEAPKVTTLDLKGFTTYFGFGSNLWLEQMAERCPGSTFIGIARLHNYRWIIHERGSANVVPVDPSSDSHNEHTYVWGMVYTITQSDEACLDVKEGVPYMHSREVRDMDFWPTSPDNGHGHIDISGPSEKKSMLVYIDHKRIKDGEPKVEYIYRMNMAISDALKMGIPSSYVEKVMRKFIPENSPDYAAVKDEVEALKQAVQF